jgi:hypothetical protein
MVGPVTAAALTLSVTGITRGLLPAPVEVMVMVPWYAPWAIPAILAVTTRVAGVVLAADETPSQLGDVAIVNGNAALPVRLTDWLAGFEPPLCPLNVKLVGLAESVGLLETTRDTFRTSGELVALELVMEIVPE